MNWITNLFSSGNSYRDYEWTDYRMYTTAVSNGLSGAYSHLPEAKVPKFLRSGWNRAYSYLPEVPNPFASSQTSLPETLWNYKEWIASGVLLTAIGVTAVYFFTRKVAQKPNVEWESSLDKGVLKISVPKTEAEPPNVNFSFCIDTSGSMQEEMREEKVKRGVVSVIEQARKVMNTAGARIDMGAVGFNNEAHTIHDPIYITKEGEGEKSMRDLKSQINAYESDGGTSICNGLDASIEQLQAMSKANPEGKNVVILLSDGKDNAAARSVTTIQKKLGIAQAEIFAIGIGDRHDKKTLEKIAGKANYIDTTEGTSIEDAIARVYGIAISSFSEMQLQLYGVPGGKWFANRVKSNADSKVNLGELTEEDSAVSFPIKVDSQNLDAELDLRKIWLHLNYRDPAGLPGKVYIPWNSDSIIRPRVIRGR